MYPYFIIQGHKIFAIGLGIALSACVFLVTAWFFVKKYKLQFNKLFFWLPTLLIATYLLWNWVGLALDSNIWFPLKSRKTTRLLLSPYGYHFHFVWLVLWAIFAWRKFFKKIFMRTEQYKWVDVFFFSFAAALMPLGLFLLLGDTFIGKPTDAWYGVVALLNDSAWTNFGRVFPLWIVVSIIWFISYFIVLLCKRFIKREKIWWYLWFAIMFFLFAAMFIWEHYVRHGVFALWNYSLDIKNYIAFLVAVYFLIQFKNTPKKR